MNLGIRTVGAQFLSWEYLFKIFGIVSLQCICWEGSRTNQGTKDVLYIVQLKPQAIIQCPELET
jgi:hypothetical protein